MSIAMRFQSPLCANDAATAPHLPSSQTFVRADLHCQGSHCIGVQAAAEALSIEDGCQDGVPSGLVYRGRAFVDALMHLLAPALILPPIPTSPHVATLA